MFVLLFIAVIMLLVPVLGNQLSAFIGHLPEYVSRACRRCSPRSAGTGCEDFSARRRDIQSLQKPISDSMTQAAGWLIAFVQSLWSGGRR